jgi:3-hydroxy-9,10-secoandrosta-1,3,5(10)-triene-9,17-dione monooxygenase reductase component
MIDATDLRRVMGYFATGVTLVASMSDGRPSAMTANSVTSVSLDPPLVLFCADRNSDTLRAVRASKAFAINILDEREERISRVFATRGPKSFQGIGFRSEATGSPVLEDALAWLDCRVHAEHEAGDHVLVLGVIERADARSEGKPLIFYRGGYHSLGD